MSPIENFYANKSILVTGATGFIGKVLIEKLLYSCRDIDKIYLLIRGSKGKNAQERMLDMVGSKPFTMRLTKTYCLNKLVAIDSDIAEKGLGLKQDDCLTLIKNVSIIFHVAASVKFEAPLEVNLRHNVVATRTLLDFACKFEKLQCFVHVSTAYSNCQLRQIEERVYPMEIPEDPLSLKLTKAMLDNRPNTYTYTKAMAENVACKYADRMNIVIVRPSIVMSSLKEPAEGWVDTINGPVGLSILGALGILQKIKVNSEVVFDLIPADTVSNALVSIAWASTERKSEFLPGNQNTDSPVTVFNLTTGQENPCSFYHYFSVGREEAYCKPSTRVLRPLIKIPKQKVDFLLNMAGQKKMVVKSVNRMHHANEVFDYFCSNQWTFKTDNVKRLRELQTIGERETFNCDVRELNWSSYARIGWIGCRKFILNEDESTIQYAKWRYRAICIMYYLIKFILLLALTFTLGRYLYASNSMIATLVMLPIYGIVYLL